MDKIDKTIKESLSFLDNEYINAGLSLFLILYASMVAPKLPGFLVNLFDNYLFKFLMFFLIVYVSRKDVTIAIICSVAVMVSLLALNRIKLNESMASVGNEETCGCCDKCNCGNKSEQLSKLTSGESEEYNGYEESEELASPMGLASDPNMQMASISEEHTPASDLSEEIYGVEEASSEMNYSDLSEDSSEEQNALNQEEVLFSNKQPVVTLAEESNLAVNGGFEEVESEENIKQQLQDMGGDTNQSMVEEVLRRKAVEESKGNPVSQHKLQVICRRVMREYKQGSIESQNESSEPMAFDAGMTFASL